MKTLWGLLLLPMLAFAQYQPTVLWDRAGATDSAAYGYKILPLGDQNDDGYADWAVYAGGNGRQLGYLEFFHGAATLPMIPFYTYRVDTSLYLRGFGPVLMADVNGDGYHDWMVNLGRLPNGINRDIGLVLGGTNPPPTPELLFTVPYRSLPLSLDDFNGDGYADLFFWNDQGDSLWCYYGGNPIDTVLDWILRQPPPGINQTYPYAFGDFNGDGASDFMCFNPNNSQIDIFLGGSNPDTIPDYVWIDPSGPSGGVKSLNGDQADEFLLGLGVHFGRDSLRSTPDVVLHSAYGGYPVSAGDFNGDGYNDLIMYAPSAGTPFGALDLHLGQSWLNPDPVFTIEGNEPPFNLRGIYTATGLGDVNGDGLDDFAVGVWNETFGPRRGRCVIFAGDTVPVSADEPRPELPRELQVSAYPNPFNSQCRITVDLPVPYARVDVTLYNLLGQVVVTASLMPVGSHLTYTLDAANLATGVYLMKLTCGAEQALQKLMLLK